MTDFVAMPCGKEFDLRKLLRKDGSLDVEPIESHLETCPQCSARKEFIHDEMRRLFGEEPNDSAPR
ncbi:MAG: hypothetical protein GF419_10805 [Ignavibacteriales bacterium]|nr:hypothetical protein [Ignavibacteriales bacterium]